MSSLYGIEQSNGEIFHAFEGGKKKKKKTILGGSTQWDEILDVCIKILKKERAVHDIITFICDRIGGVSVLNQLDLGLTMYFTATNQVHRSLRTPLCLSLGNETHCSGRHGTMD